MERPMSNLENQRTYAIVGTGGCGKTSLAEMLLFKAGVINRLGKIEEGSTTLDYEEEEINHKASVQPAFATLTWNKNRHFFIDAPGDGNFIGDLGYLLTAVDSVVFTIDAVDGVRPLSKKIWGSIKSLGLPAIIYVNKLGRDRADFNMALDDLSGVLGVKPVVLYMPIGGPGEFKGVVDILASRALMFSEGGGYAETDIPADLAEMAASLRETTVENIAESDDALMEKYLDQGELSHEELEFGLKKGVLTGIIAPVLVGDALENKGGTLLLNAIQALLPSPLEHADWQGEDGSVRKSAPDGPCSLFVCKTIADPFSGHLSVCRILSGSITGETTLTNSASGEAERVTPQLLTGKTHTPHKEELGPGALVALAKLKNTKTGNTLSDDKHPFTLKIPALPPQLIAYALGAKEKGDDDKVYSAVQKLLEDDITLRLYRDEATGEILLAGMGQLHVEIAVEQAKRRSKVDIVLKTPQIPYRETIRGSAQVQGRHKKQTGGRGQFGDCWVEFSPLERGAGYAFEDAVVGGSIPRQYIPAVDKGIQEAAGRGFLAGYPLVDFKAKLNDGSYHNVDSSEMAFKVAGSLAFKKAMEQVKPILLEPIVLLTVSIPDEFMGDVIGDLSSRRGKVLGSDSQGGLTDVRANVPMSEVLRYAPDLRSMTGGQGVFTMEFDHYEEAPAPVVEKVVAEYKAVEE